MMIIYFIKLSGECEEWKTYGNRKRSREMKLERKFRYILASQSPRRRELLRKLGLEAEVMPSHLPEERTTDDPRELVEMLARQKAEDIGARLGILRSGGKAGRADGCPEEGGRGAARIEEGENKSRQEEMVILAADTVVSLEGRILGKPGDHEEACRMVKEMQGRRHQVFTGVMILSEKQRELFSVETEVYVHAMTEEEIRSYAALEEPMDKAGAYGIQGEFCRYIDKIEGDFYNVMGLPIASLYQHLKRMQLWEEGNDQQGL